jgi:hypothetical protein
MGYNKLRDISYKKNMASPDDLYLLLAEDAVLLLVRDASEVISGEALQSLLGRRSSTQTEHREKNSEKIWAYLRLSAIRSGLRVEPDPILWGLAKHLSISPKELAELLICQAQLLAERPTKIKWRRGRKRIAEIE